MPKPFDSPRIRFCPRFGLMGIVVSGIALLAFGSASRPIHPQDGPHADIEIEILGHAVVFDLFMNLVMIDEMYESSRENPADIHPVEEEAVLAALVEYLAANHRVAIDNIEVAPIVRSFSVVRGEPSNVVLFPRSGMRGLNKIHLVLEYPLKGEVSSVAMRWGTFPDDLTVDPDTSGNRPPIRLEARLRAEGKLRIVTFTHDEPEYIFHATGLTADDRFAEVPSLTSILPAERSVVTIPMVSAALALGHAGFLVGVLVRPANRHRLFGVVLALPLTAVAAVLLRDTATIPISLDTSEPVRFAEADAAEVFRPLHANIYRAFDYRTESEIYDALSRSVSGEMLDTLYNQIFRSLIMVEEGGAVSSVQDVRLDELTIESVGQLESGAQGFTALARWQVDGVVNHFGHSHWRTIEYLARFGVVESPEGWRLASHEPLEQQRLDTDPFVDPSDTSSPPPAPLQEL